MRFSIRLRTAALLMSLLAPLFLIQAQQSVAVPVPFGRAA